MHVTKPEYLMTFDSDGEVALWKGVDLAPFRSAVTRAYWQLKPYDTHPLLTRLSQWWERMNWQRRAYGYLLRRK